MPRALSLYAPMWPIDLVRRRHRSRRSGAGEGKKNPAALAQSGERRRPFARGGSAGGGGAGETPRAPDGSSRAILLVQTSAGVTRVAARCERAAAAGVEAGMTLAHARALLPHDGVHVEPFDEERDRAALDGLAAWALRFSPIVAPAPPDGLLLDIDGCQRLFHGERRLVNTLVNSAEWLGIRCRVAVAATYGAAWAVARFGVETRAIVPAGREVETLAPLPVEALRIGSETASGLREIGIDRIGHLLDLPRLELAMRFDAELLRRLDQATGRQEETIDPIRVVEPPRFERAFDGPVSRPEAVTVAVRALLAPLAEELERRESGVTRLRLECDRADADPVHETIELSRPSRSVRHLWSLLAPRVEAIHLGFGIERVVLRALATGPLRHTQRTRWRAGGDGDAVALDRALDRALGEFVDTVAERLGPERTVRVETVESHVPERAFARRSAGPAAGAAPGRLPTPAGTRPSGRGGVRSAAAVTASERPSILFDRPEPIEVMALSPEGAPSWLRWRGAARTIVAGLGPERIEPEWWGGSDGATERRSDEGGEDARDYFRVQDEGGRWLWVYRQVEGGRWFVHGQWA